MSKLIEVLFTTIAKEAIKLLLEKDFDHKDPKEWHTEKVRQFTKDKAEHLPGVTEGWVRGAAHRGGENLHEAEHITVEFKARGNRIEGEHGGLWHVPTGR